MQFDRNMLPALGVIWRGFANELEAKRFARWAENETRHDQWPCEAYVWREDDRPADERWQVKVVNW